VVAENGGLRVPLPHLDWESYGSRPRFDASLELADPTLYPLRASGTEAEVPVMHLRSAVITERREARVGAQGGLVPLDGPGELLHAALVDREGKWISRALVSGFAANLEGLASTYNTTTHLLVLGRRLEAMARAARRVRELDGGIVVVKGGEVVYELALPITGMMSGLPFAEVVERNRRLSRVMAEAGYEHHDILYTLLFLTCDFLPALRLTPLGLLDVKSSQTLAPVEQLTGPSDS
jgi:adenine deaminase